MFPFNVKMQLGCLLVIFLFFYRDINRNNSFFTKQIQENLEKNGLLDPILLLLKSLNKLLEKLIR